jgi:hypothetical protein
VNRIAPVVAEYSLFKGEAIMSKTVFQRYTSEAGEQYEFELTDEGGIYLFDRSTESRTRLNETDRSAIERGLITIGDWESDPAGYQKAVEFYVNEAV